MNIKHYALLIMAIYTYCTSQCAVSPLHFSIKKTSEETDDKKADYEIVIGPSNEFLGPLSNWKGPSEQLVSGPYSQPKNTIVLKSAVIRTMISASNETPLQSYLQKLDKDIRDNIIDSIFYVTNNSKNSIDVTVDLFYLTTFNKAYRELYNQVRGFSKDLAGRISEPEYFSTLKQLFNIKSSEETFKNPGVILPDLVSRQLILTRAYQAHPKITTATTLGAAALGAYLLSKQKSYSSAHTPASD